MKLELIPVKDTDPEITTWDFSAPENVLIEVIMHDPATDWGSFGIESTSIISTSEVAGAASYELEHGFLDYTIQAMTNPPGEGWFVVEGVTAVYSRGDGWMTEDEMRFSHTGIRPATAEEIAEGQG